MRRYRSYHFIGIGGIGMSAIAQMLYRHGIRVTGSDVEPSHITQQLQNIGIPIYYGHKASNINDAECVVYSSSIHETNPERQEALRKSVPLKHRSEALVLASQDKKVIAIAGTHGKTTTTAMLGLIYHEAGLAPTVVVGGRVSEFGGNNFLMGVGNDMILEADESDASFLAYAPQIALVTNIDRDHLDHFESMDDIHRTFRDFLKKIKSSGYWVGCSECHRTKGLLTELSLPNISYGLDETSDLWPRNVVWHGSHGATFDVFYQGKNMGQMRLKIPGMHNVLNALGVTAIAMTQGISFDRIQSALSKFTGVTRRFDVKCKDETMFLVDDYAHHPAEIKATLQAARSFSHRKILAVFQPHRYSRLEAMMNEFSKSFDNADEIIITDVYAAGEKPLSGRDAKDLVYQTQLQYPDREVSYCAFPNLIDLLIKKSNADNLILTMGAGSIGKISNELKAIHEKQFC